MTRSRKLTLESPLTCAIVVFFVLLSDQASKFIVMESMRLGESHSVLPFFNIVMVKNSGVTFGIFREAAPPMVFALISAIIVVFLLTWVRKHRNCTIPIALIVGGAIGNVFDRITRGAVVDFLDFHLCGYHWPAFNIADSAIVVGVSILLFISSSEEKT